MPSIPFKQRISATIAEACEASGLGKTKIYELISEKKSPHRPVQLLLAHMAVPRTLVRVQREWLIPSTTWKADICRGLDPKLVARVQIETIKVGKRTLVLVPSLLRAINPGAEAA
jgi:hypothetical protein